MDDSQSDEKFFEVKIDSSSLRIFSAALHLCQKVGKEVIIGENILCNTTLNHCITHVCVLLLVHLEVEEHALTLRSLNDNKSAYISVEFSSDYFDNFNLCCDTAFACKLPVRVRINLATLDICIYNHETTLLIANLYGHAQPQAGEKYRLNSISNRLGS
jgi:hypothetical protein